MSGRLNPMRVRLLLLVSASAAALAGAQAQSRNDGGFLIEAPAGVPAAGKTQAAPPEAPAAAPARKAPPRIGVKPIDAEEGGPDETALRYYAAQNQMKRVAAEIERLRRLYPYWRPPETLVEPANTSSEDEQPLWDLFGADRLDELRAAIEQRQRAEPDWRPSKDLTDKIARKELRLRLMSFWRAGNLNEMMDSVTRDGYGGDRADVDLQWTVAEAHARMKRTGEAVEIYRSLLRTVADPHERLTTIQKAMETLRIADVEPLFAEMKADGAQNELAPLANEITRARISAYLRDERAERIPDLEFKAFQDHVRGLDDPNQIGLIAWYHLKNRQTRDALEWFKLALERGGDAMIAHGLANALRELGMKREAEEVAFAWRDELVNNAILYIDVLETDLTSPAPPVIEPDRLMRYARVTMDLASGEGAQALGWYAYNTCQYDIAREWFERAVAWYPKETTVHGLMLSMQRTKRSREMYELANRYDGLFPKVIGVIFPDGYQRPPSACDMAAAGARAPAGMRGPLAALTPAPAPAPAAQRHAHGGVPAASGPWTAQQAAWGQQQGWPAYQPPALVPAANDQMPKFARGEFPAAVDPENPRRAASSGKILGRPLQISAPPATQTLLRAEQARPAPLVARRVQGVGPMPYERWGFSLLPGANGQTAPDSPHSAQTAPAGTVWASEPTGSRPVDVYVDPYQVMQVIAAQPRIPAPNVVRSMPMAPAAPNVMRGVSLRPGLDVDMTATGSVDAVEPVAPDQADGAAPEAATRAEDEGEWRPRLSDVLAQLGRSSPQARLGCPFTSLDDVRSRCAGAPPPAAPE